MKKITIVLIIITITSNLYAPIRTPQMPRGLTVDKKESPVIKTTDATTIKKQHAQKKIRRKGLQGYKKHATFSDMNMQELMAAKEHKLKEKNWDIAGKYLERMIKLCDDVNEKATLIIELADLLFKQEKYADATQWYTEFTQLYPGNSNIEYASYKAIICASKEILSIDRDQSATQKALTLATDFLKRDTFTTYTKEVSEIYNLCQHTLAQSDCYIAEFYLKHKSFTAAQRRLTNIRTDWKDKVPEIKAPLALLEIALANEYPEFKAPEESIKLAQAALPADPIKKTDMTSRF